MNAMPETPELAMPIGLPKPGSDVEQHYAALSTQLVAMVNSDNTIVLWTADDPRYADAYAMVRAAVRYRPQGSADPDGATFTTNTLLLQTWLWEYLALQSSAGSGVLIPSTIRMSNIDSAALTSLVHAELESNPRYAQRSVSERAQIEQEFLAGNLRLLVNAGTTIARGAVDPAPPQPSLAGNRKIELAFLSSQGTVLDPYLYFAIWRLIAGPLVQGHPLLDMISRDVWPVTAPVEGQTRVRIKVSQASAGASVQVGGAAATDVRLSTDGAALYATLPAGTEGAQDIVITITGQPAKTLTAGIRYVSDLIETARAVTASFVVHLRELLEITQARVTSGTLDAETRRDLLLELELAHRLSYQAIDLRAQASATFGTNPGVIAALKQNESTQTALLEQLFQALS